MKDDWLKISDDTSPAVPPAEEGVSDESADSRPDALADAAPAARKVTERLNCIRCGANLQGRPSDGFCPNCAKPVAESLRGDFLVFSPPILVRRLADAVQIIQAAAGFVGVLFALALGTMVVQAISTGLPARAVEDAFKMLVSFGIFSPVIALLGMLLLVQRDPWRESQVQLLARPRVTRLALRLSPLLVLTLAAAFHSARLMAVWLQLIWIVAPAVLCLRALERVMRRIPNLRLALATRNYVMATYVFGLMVFAGAVGDVVPLPESLVGPAFSIKFLSVLMSVGLGAFVMRLLQSARLTLAQSAREALRNEGMVRDFARELETGRD